MTCLSAQAWWCYAIITIDASGHDTADHCSWCWYFTRITTKTTEFQEPSWVVESWSPWWTVKFKGHRWCFWIVQNILYCFHHSYIHVVKALRQVKYLSYSYKAQCSYYLLVQHKSYNQPLETKLIVKNGKRLKAFANRVIKNRTPRC